MFSFVSYLIATILFFLCGHKDIEAVNQVWGFFFVALGLTLSYLPTLVTTYKERRP